MSVSNPICAGRRWCGLLFLVALFTASCSPVSPSNPYDPDTPASQQAKGQVIGRLLLGEEFSASEVFDNLGVELVSASASINNRQTAVSEDGAFVFSDVVAGVYQLKVRLQGFEDLSELIVLEIGGKVSLGELTLVPLVLEGAAVRQFVVGSVTFAGRQGEVHDGISVEAVGFPYRTQTTVSGDYSLEVPPGSYTLRFSSRGYNEVRLSGVLVVGGNDANMEPQQLVPIGGRVAGTVRLSSFETPARLQSVDLSLVDESGSVNATLNPDAMGRFNFTNVPPGQWQVLAERQGYESQRSYLTLEPSQAMQVSTLTLVHSSATSDAVSFSGRVRLSDRLEHDGTEIRLYLLPEALFAGTVITRLDGSFAFTVSKAERYSVEVVRVGYAEPIGWGAFEYNDTEGVFLNSQGELPEAVLLPSTTATLGSVAVRPTVVNDWLPQSEQFVNVTLEQLAGTQAPQQLNGVQSGAAAIFDGLSLGRYLVKVSRAGFTSYTELIELTEDEPDVSIGPVPMNLLDMGESGILLAGRSVSACQLRELESLAGANLSALTISGNLGPVAAGSCPACRHGSEAACGPLNFENASLSNSDLSGVTGALGVRFVEASLFGARLDGVDLSGANLERASLASAGLSDSVLIGVNLRNADLADTDLRSAQFSRPVLEEEVVVSPCGTRNFEGLTQLAGADFAGANLSGAVLDGLQLSEIDFSGNRLVGARMVNACLQDASMSLADLSDVDLSFADARGLRAINAVFARTSLQGAVMSDSFLAGAVLEDTDFSCGVTGADGRCACRLDGGGGEVAYRAVCLVDSPSDQECLCTARLDGANFIGAYVLGTDFSGADLSRSTFAGAIFAASDSLPSVTPFDCVVPDDCDTLSPQACVGLPAACQTRPVRMVDVVAEEASFSGITGARLNVTGSNFTKASFDGASIRRSWFSETSFEGANLEDANFSSNRFLAVNLRDANLRRVVLDGVVFEEMTFLGRSDMTGASLVGADAQRLRFDEAVTEGVDVEGADLCEFRSGFVGRPNTFEPTCGPFEQIVRGGSFAWSDHFKTGLLTFPKTELQKRIVVDVGYDFALKTTPFTYLDVALYFEELKTVNPNGYVFGPSDPRNEFSTFFDDTNFVGRDLQADTCGLPEFGPLPDLAIPESIECVLGRSPLLLRNRNATGYPFEVGADGGLLFGEWRDSFDPWGPLFVVALMNEKSLEHGFEPCFVRDSTGEPFRFADFKNSFSVGIPPYSSNGAPGAIDVAWPNGLNCNGYRWPTRSELFLTMSNRGDRSFLERRMDHGVDFYGDGLPEGVFEPMRPASVCSHLADTTASGVCDLMGNVGELGIGYEYSGCDSWEGAANVFPSASTGFRNIRVDEYAQLFEQTFVAAAGAEISGLMDVLYWGSDVEAYDDWEGGLKNWLPTVQAFPGAGLFAGLGHWGYRSARTLREPCEDEGLVETRQCGGIGGTQSRECVGGTWTIWSPCLDDQKMCCSDFGCVSPKSQKLYGWRDTGVFDREVRVVVGDEFDGCLSAYQAPTYSGAFIKPEFASAKQVHCDATNEGQQIQVLAQSFAANDFGLDENEFGGLLPEERTDIVVLRETEGGHLQGLVTAKVGSTIYDRVNYLPIGPIRTTAHPKELKGEGMVVLGAEVDSERLDFEFIGNLGPMAPELPCSTEFKTRRMRVFECGEVAP